MMKQRSLPRARQVTAQPEGSSFFRQPIFLLSDPPEKSEEERKKINVNRRETNKVITRIGENDIFKSTEL